MIQNKIGLSILLFLRRSSNLIGMGGRKEKTRGNDFNGS